jgi:hypothetical protein
MNARLALGLPTVLFFVVSASSQHVSLGVKGGFPFTYSMNTTNVVDLKVDSSSREFIAGGTAEVSLPFGVSVEGDFLYHPFNIRTTGFVLPPTNVTTYTVFEIPILAKLRFGRGLARPYVEAGPEFRTHPGSLSISHDGFAVGGGLELKLLLIKVSPEVRFTHWASGSLTGTNDNQAAVLVGLSF